MPHSTDGYAGFHSLPAPGRGGSQDSSMLSLLKQTPLIRAMAPERQAVRAVLPAEDRLDMSHPQAVQAAQNRMKALGVDKIAAILTTDEVYAAARRTPDYEVLRKRMEARRDGRDPDDVAKVGPDRACPKCGSDDIRIREAHADTGMDEMEGTCRKCDYRDDADKFRPAKTAAMDAAPDGGENHPPLLSNPFLGDPKNEPEYANGYAYAQALGHQQLNVATDGDVQRWMGSAPSWLAGFCAGARSLGVGRLADTIEAYKPTAKIGSVMDDLDLNDTFASEAIKTSGVMLPLVGAGLGGLTGAVAGGAGLPLALEAGQPGVLSHAPIADTEGAMGIGALGGGTLGSLAGLGAGSVADRILPERKVAGAVEDSFATRALDKTAGPLTTAGTTLMGAGLGGMIGSELPVSHPSDLPVDAAQADPSVLARAGDAAQSLGHSMHALPYVGSHLPMSDQALGGAAVGAGAGLAGGLALGRLTDREEHRPTIAAY